MSQREILLGAVERLREGSRLSLGDMLAGLRPEIDRARVTLVKDAFCHLSLSAVATLERDRLARCGGKISRKTGGEVEAFVIGANNQVYTRSGYIAGPDAEARARLIALLLAKLEEMEAA